MRNTFALFERFPQARALIDVGHANVNKLPMRLPAAVWFAGSRLPLRTNNDGEADKSLEYSSRHNMICVRICDGRRVYTRGECRLWSMSRMSV